MISMPFPLKIHGLKKKRVTDRRTDGPTDGRTDPNIESLVRD